MKFNKQIFIILILSFLVSLAASGCISQGEGAKEQNTKEVHASSVLEYQGKSSNTMEL